MFQLNYSSILMTGLLILGAQLACPVSNAQFKSDTEGFYFDNTQLGARAVSLGNTMVSDSYGLEGIYTNPAAFLFSESNTSLFTSIYYNYFNDVMVENITGVVTRTDEHLISFGATFQHKGLGNAFPKDSAYPVDFNQYGFTFNYATLLAPTLSIGAGISGSYGITESASDWAMVSNIGLFYAPSASVSYGLAFRGIGTSKVENLGSGLLYTQSENEFGQTDEESTQLELKRLPHRLEIGTTFRFPTMARQPDFKLTLANEKVFGESGLIYKAGIEVYPHEVLALRGGYSISSFTSGGRIGIGLFLNNITLDYSLSEPLTRPYGFSHQLSISMGF